LVLATGKCGLIGGAAAMDLSWLDMPFTLTRLLAYDYYGDVAAAFANDFSI
jgi:hypothetical protein